MLNGHPYSWCIFSYNLNHCSPLYNRCIRNTYDNGAGNLVSVSIRGESNEADAGLCDVVPLMRVALRTDKSGSLEMPAPPDERRLVRVMRSKQTNRIDPHSLANEIILSYVYTELTVNLSPVWPRVARNEIRDLKAPFPYRYRKKACLSGGKQSHSAQDLYCMLDFPPHQQMRSNPVSSNNRMFDDLDRRVTLSPLHHRAPRRESEVRDVYRE